MKTDWDVIVVGGGPAGFFAAIRCAELNPSLNVLIIEKATQTLGKVIVSGGGRCNVTHACFDPARLVAFYPRGGNELRGAFARFQPRDTIAWFETRGVKLKTEADGRIFPVTDDSNTIADCLRSAAKSAGVEVWGHARLGRVDRNQDESFQLTTQTLRDVFTRLRAGKLLLATGSDRKTLAIVKLLGHTVVDPVPSLFTFNVRDERIKGLEGVSVASVSLKMDSLSTQGALLITHWGLSGPAVLRLSAWGAREFYGMNYRAELTINWLDNYSFDKALDVLQRNKAWKENARKKLSSHAAFSQIPARLWKRLVDFIGDKNWADVSKEELRKLAKELTAGTFTIQSKGVFKEEFVTCGGVNLKEVDFKTMQSRVVKGLFFAGEVLDIDGVTGGFNFQSSWTTGWIAGSAMGAPG